MLSRNDRDEGMGTHEEALRYASESHEERSDSEERDGSPQHSPIGGSYGSYDEDHHNPGKTIAYLDDRKRLPPQKAASPIVLQWLQDNYDSAEGTSLPRSTLYAHYVAFCQSATIEPVNAASFGKLIRSIFPHLKTRRLGTRGHSKYHYYGIQIKSTSDLKLPAIQTSPDGSVPPKPKPTRMKKEFEGEMKMPPPSHPTYESSHSQTVCPTLPEFLLNDTGNFTHESAEQVQTFLNLYRQHCQILVDVVHRQAFAEVEKVLRSFWQGLPAPYRSLVSRPDVTELIVHKDSLTYKAMAHSLLPNVLQALPVSVPQAIRQYAKSLEMWLMNALENFPANLQIRKMSVCKRFCQSLHKQASLNHLTQAARNVLQNPNTLSQMIMDWNRLDFDFIRDQASWVCQCGDEIIQTAQEDFKNFLTQRATLEQWAQWLQDIVSKILGKCTDPKDLVFVAQQLLLKWSFYSTLVIRDLTIRNASSFSSYHLLRTLFDDYIFYLIDSKFATISQTSHISMGTSSHIPMGMPSRGNTGFMNEDENAYERNYVPTSSHVTPMTSVPNSHLSHASHGSSHVPTYQHERSMHILQDEEYSRFDNMSNMSHQDHQQVVHVPQFQQARNSFNGVVAPPSVLRQTMYSSGLPVQSQLSQLSQISQLSSQMLPQQHGFSSHSSHSSHNSHNSHNSNSPLAYSQQQTSPQSPNSSPPSHGNGQPQYSGQMSGQLSGQMPGPPMAKTMDELRSHMVGSFDRLSSNLKRNSAEVSFRSQNSHGNGQMPSVNQPMTYLTFASSEMGTRGNFASEQSYRDDIPKKPRVETQEVK
eukprot:TRINITY_DN10562_c0_g1_i1.p1 TRINITY_DN10562_c0_g1~~TRINITY_DN10562_c0_g1_i1.p1  ORF type:complete len:811 (-),score=186.33 TRINITY_DN10562_c0_g1_i1:169-2601(-)